MLWVGFGLYVAVVLLLWRPVAGAMAWRWCERHNERFGDYNYSSSPAGDQWLGGYVFGFGLCAVWPLSGLLLLMGRPSLTVGAEARALAQAQQARIEELEKEMNV